MKLPRRGFLHLAAGAAALPAVSRIARAQTYPTRPVRIVVGFGPGGVADVTARLMAQWLSERLGQPFVVENRPGAGSNIATEVALRAPADGYTLLLASNSNAINATLYEKLNFNFIRDIAPIASINDTPGVMEVNPAFPAKTVAEFIAYAKANPGKINMAVVGVGSATHVTGELFKAMASVDLVAVQYRDPGPAHTDLIAGQMDVMFDPLVSSIEQIRAGKLRALAVTTATRSFALRGIRGQSWQDVFWLRPRGGHVGQEQIDLGRLKPGQGDVESFGRQKVNQLAELDREHFTIPTGLFGDLVVCDQIGALLHRGEMAEPNNRHVIQPFQPGRIDTPMAGKNHIGIIDKHGV
jgi:tripartite-type tricarboxylate transporter receptor subunit TctC